MNYFISGVIGVILIGNIISNAMQYVDNRRTRESNKLMIESIERNTNKLKELIK
ncbi:hypothetical protein ACV3R5_10750 [Clostridium perfringens]|uniref:Uncharacterized protein n=1 Tax=Clostridium perfringens TaxID=1502 RepID=A0A133MQ43_CLOPF|nr:hypothetical protein [Clostridium perfringens]ELU5587482.1 hypothetical protein [Clostridium perfringens]KXA06156.1 hypothetical protein HMPREF3222_02916 [Clostridium perfringens]